MTGLDFTGEFPLSDSTIDACTDAMGHLAYDTLDFVKDTLEFEMLDNFHLRLMQATIGRLVIDGWCGKVLIREVKDTIEQTLKNIDEWDAEATNE